MYWDGEEEPSVLAPLGDFFGLGHARAYTYNCAFFTCSANHQGHLSGKVNEGVAMNCWLHMPFRRSARIELVNEQPAGCDVGLFYYYIDWQQHPSLPKETMYLHAQWRRENPAIVKADDSPECRRMLEEEKNLTDRYNYLILNAVGHGHYIGMNMSVDNLCGGWWARATTCSSSTGTRGPRIGAGPGRPICMEPGARTICATPGGCRRTIPSTAGSRGARRIRTI